jgi:nucleoside-diphosphate-sugar epimerase
MDKDKKLNIVITGANGFIGSYLTAFLSSKGHQVYALVHHLYKQAPKNVKYRAFDLKSFASDVIPNDTDIVIHAAYIPFIKGVTQVNINEIATSRLYKIAKRKNVSKFIFLSSLSATDDAISEYGKSKYNISKIIDKETDLVLKPGLVIGNGGLYKRIDSLIRNSKIIPLIGGGKQPLQYILIENLAQIIESAISKNISGEYSLAHNDSILMKDLYLYISKNIDKKTVLIPFPYLFADLAFGLIRLFKINIGISEENYLGLKNMKLNEISDFHEVFKIKLDSLK